MFFKSLTILKSLFLPLISITKNQGKVNFGQRKGGWNLISRLSRKYLKEHNPAPGIVFSPQKVLKGVSWKMLRDEKDIIRLEEVADGSWPWTVWQSLLPDYKTLCTHIMLLHCWSKIIFSCFPHISARLAQYLLFIFSSLEFINVPNTTVPYCHMYSYICMYTCKCAVLCLVAQPCPNLCDPMDHNRPGSSVHGDYPGKNTGVGCHAFL